MLKKRAFHFFSSFILLILSTTNPLASEKQHPTEAWAKAVSMKLSPGILETLTAGSQQLTMIRIEPRGNGKAHGSIILLHDINQHPDWRYVIKPLRIAFPQFGWSSLSIPLPPMPEGTGDKALTSVIAQVAANIQAASTLAQSKTAGNVVLIGYGTGARLAVNWLSKTPDPSIAALILISMASSSSGTDFDSNSELRSIRIPVLDLIAENDKPAVLSAARKRWQQRSQLKQYRQIEIAATGQYYSQQEDELVKRIRGWLKKTLKGY